MVSSDTVYTYFQGRFLSWPTPCVRLELFHGLFASMKIHFGKMHTLCLLLTQRSLPPPPPLPQKKKKERKEKNSLQFSLSIFVLQAGVAKLNQAAEHVADLKHKAASQSALLAEKQAEADSALKQITTAMEVRGRKRFCTNFNKNAVFRISSLVNGSVIIRFQALIKQLEAQGYLDTLYSEKREREGGGERDR